MAGKQKMKFSGLQLCFGPCVTVAQIWCTEGGTLIEKITIFDLIKNVFWLYHAAGGILVPQPGTEPVPPALEAQNLNPWTTRDVLQNYDF